MSDHEPVEASDPAQIQDPVGSVGGDEVQVRTGLENLVTETLYPVCIGLGATIGTFALAQWLLLPAAAATQTSLLAAATAAACLGVAVLARRGAIPQHASHPVAAVIAFLICANSLYRLYFLSDPQQTTWLILLIVGAACLFVSVKWLLAVVAVVHLGWWSIALAVTPERAWQHFGISLIAATIFAIVVQLGRVRILRRIQEMRLREQRLEEELRRAMLVAQRGKDLFQELSMTDALTGLFNRRSIVDLLEREVVRSAREGKTLAIVMVDIDRLKPVNDTHGHLAGDAALQEVAWRIRHTVRSYDLVGRYAGGEFLVVLPGCDEEQACRVAERIRTRVCDEPINATGHALQMTASLGVAVAHPGSGIELESLVHAADLALYSAKDAGRDRVESAGLVSGRRELTFRQRVLLAS